MQKTLFERIASGELAGEILYRDDTCFVLKDIQPQAPVHVLVIPLQPIPSLRHAKGEDALLLGHLLKVAAQMAESLGLVQGFRVVINTGVDAGESVPHLHVHLLGGRSLGWPPG